MVTGCQKGNSLLYIKQNDNAIDMKVLKILNVELNLGVCKYCTIATSGCICINVAKYALIQCANQPCGVQRIT